MDICRFNVSVTIRKAAKIKCSLLDNRHYNISCGLSPNISIGHSAPSRWKVSRWPGAAGAAMFNQALDLVTTLLLHSHLSFFVRKAEFVRSQRTLDRGQ